MKAHVLVMPAGEEPARPVEAARQLDSAEMAAANINPATGLATDYLNHFNEAIMMLELIPSMPACIGDLMAWNVMTYREHFLVATQKHREDVLVAYDTADPQARIMVVEIAETLSRLEK